MATQRHPAARVDAAWAALQAGQWGRAKELFTRLAAIDESAEAYEGLSWSTWWLDEPDALFDARGRAYRLYRERDDPAGAARMATWLACDHLDFRGALAVANGWLRRARRLLEPLPPSSELGWLAFFEGHVAQATGDLGRAADDARRAAEIGRRFAVPDLEMLGLALEGSTLVACGRVPDGMRCLDEAMTTALEEQTVIPISSAWVCCYLVTACTSVRDYERAFEWCDRIAEYADQLGSRYLLAMCRSEYGAVHLWRGRWDEAERMLAASVTDFAVSRPPMAPGPMAMLAELRRRQGRRAESIQLLDQAGPAPPTQLCRARLALDRGKPARAVELAERILRQTPVRQRLDRASVFEVLVRARTAAGDLGEASAALDALAEIELAVGTEALRASVDLAGGALATASGDHERGRPLLEDAVDRFQRIGAPYESGQARIELATTLLALGRVEAVEREASIALRQLEELGADPAADAARRLLAGSTRIGEDSQGLSSLTPREREVMRLLCDGLSNRRIAERLVVSEHTVHRHVTNILRKLDLPSRTAAAALASRHGLCGRSADASI
jgi:LuxR family transcriptional regulator, maltose regulon positive regulatory protein